MPEEMSQRDRVRAMVKEMLANTPVEGESTLTAQSAIAQTPSPAPKDPAPEHVLVNSLKGETRGEFDRDESEKSLITEDDLRGLDHGATVRVSDTAKFTPLARDIISEKNIQLIRKPERRGTKIRSVGVGCDHGGFKYKEELKSFLAGMGLQVRDFGTNSDAAVDYPDYAHAVASAVGAGHCEIGIIIDGAGIGSAMTANKVPGVRAAACYNAALAHNSREHNGANVLTLGSGQNTLAEVKDIVTAFLGSELTEDRHKKRVGKIDAIERQYKR